MWKVLKPIIALVVLLALAFGCNEEEPELAVETIVVSGSDITDGGSTQMKAEVLPADAAIKDVTWSLSNSIIASISETGLLTAKENGNVTVIATATDDSGVSGSELIRVSGVTGDVILVESITISADDITDASAQQLSATVVPANASNPAVVWSVDDESIATISQTGLLTPIRNGDVTITVSAQDGSGVANQFDVSIAGFVESITIMGRDITDGGAQQLTVEVLPANAANKMVTWTVDNESIALIDQSGNLTPRDNGTVTVTATSQDASGVSGELMVSISGVQVTVDGTVVDNTTDLLSAINGASAGDKIYIRSGTYAFSSPVRLNRDGQNGNLISLLAYPNDSRPVLDFSAMSENSSNRGVILSGDYWHVKGIDVYNAGDNGMFISGHNNLIEFCYFYENSDSGLQIGNGASNNVVLNCDSYYNADSSIENADGFAAKLDVGSGNKFIGCRAWQNLDDGWDGYLRGADDVTTTYENCWAIRNGILKNGTVGGGDGNGFKTGGSDNKDLKHHASFSNCIAAGNVVDGFDHNSNRGDIVMYNCGSHDNGRNINFGSGNIANALTIKNSSSVGGGGNSFNATNLDVTNNSWQDRLAASSADYESLNIDLLLSPRQADGSLPDISYMKLVQSSDLIDSGIDVGLDFTGSAPDIGPFESGL